MAPSESGRSVSSCGSKAADQESCWVQLLERLPTQHRHRCAPKASPHEVISKILRRDYAPFVVLSIKVVCLSLIVPGLVRSPTT
jgi:hypothetical protein